jgi:hypothetical protein
MAHKNPPMDYSLLTILVQMESISI